MLAHITVQPPYEAGSYTLQLFGLPFVVFLLCFALQLQSLDWLMDYLLRGKEAAKLTLTSFTTSREAAECVTQT